MPRFLRSVRAAQYPAQTITQSFLSDHRHLSTFCSNVFVHISSQFVAIVLSIFRVIARDAFVCLRQKYVCFEQFVIIKFQEIGNGFVNIAFPYNSFGSVFNSNGLESAMISYLNNSLNRLSARVLILTIH